MRKYPIDAVLAITYQCNSRCLMCDIWKRQDKPLMTPADYHKLPNSLRDVNISGGEPFLRADIVEVTKAVHLASPKAQIVVSTNGMLTDVIAAQMAKLKALIPSIGVGVSIDGIGPMHDKIRGIDGAFSKAINTVEKLQEIGLRNIRLAFTVSTLNVDHLSRVYNLSRKLNCQFTIAFAQSSDFYFGGKQNYEQPDPKILKREFDYLIKQEIKSHHPKRWMRAYFTNGLYDFAVRRQQPLESYAGEDFFFLDPAGQVYPSVVDNYVMGNLRTNTFDEVWFSQTAEQVRKQVHHDAKPVWMICTARTAIKRHPLAVGQWIIKEKIKHHLNLANAPE